MFKNEMKKLKQDNNGFTIVELIVVVVIILILAGAIVPNVMKYNQNAKGADCKADASYILTQLQADHVADMGGIGPNGKTGGNYNIQGIMVEFTLDPETSAALSASTANVAQYAMTDQSITSFTYSTTDGYTARWSVSDGWSVGATQQAN